MKWLLGTPAFFEQDRRESLVWTLRERTVVPIAVVPRFYLFSLAVKIRGQRRPLPLFHNRSVLSAALSGKRFDNLLKNAKKKPPWLDDTIFDAAYPGDGRDSYHPYAN
ncbi:hypothetical protein PaeBR_04625 [Paenibacillus sp. BR2-3]|uniref:hypothetical protein n=1 Tax=Paenibacillus sp. BR2-3 TaxID=3048494 RepID=UPI003977959B